MSGNGAYTRWPQDGPNEVGLGERVALGLGLAAIATGLLVWATGQLAGVLFGTGWPAMAPADIAGVLARLPGQLADPARAWPEPARATLPGPAGMWTAAAALTAAIVALAFAIRRAIVALRPRLALGAPPARGASWASMRDLRALFVRSPVSGRVTLGLVHGRLLAAEPRQSVVVVAPTQSLKTTGLAIPAILEWDGPVLAASVKSDLLADTLARRQALGLVHVYDPTACTGIPSSGWTPLSGCATWQGAQQVAAWLCAAAQPGRSTLADADFWYTAAAKLLAPVLYAAARSDATMTDVVRWVDTQERDQLKHALIQAECEPALIAAEATWGREERQRSSIYTTAETVLAAYADPGVLDTAVTGEITPDWLLDGGAHTLYLCAPTHEQQRLRPLFATLIQQLLAAVYARASQHHGPLDRPLLVVLDEAANIAPLRDLDTLASTAAGQGIQLVTVFQDLAQVRERWGERAQTIVNNHRAKILGAGTADPATIDYAARVLGDEEVRQVSSTAGREGRASKTESTTWRTLAPAHVLRQAEPGTGVLVYGHMPPARLTLRPWFADRHLRQLATDLPAATSSDHG